jgi:hypothetical protein
MCIDSLSQTKAVQLSVTKFMLTIAFTAIINIRLITTKAAARFNICNGLKQYNKCHKLQKCILTTDSLLRCSLLVSHSSSGDKESSIVEEIINGVDMAA